MCVRALSCISCAKRARRLKIVLRSGNICTSVIAGSGRSVALRRCHTGNAPRSSSVNQLCCLAASPRVAGIVKGYFSRSHFMQYAPKNRVAALLPRTVTVRGTRVEAGPPPPPPAWPAHNLLFGTQRRRREKIRLDAFVKRVFQEQAIFALRCWPSNSAVSRRTVRSDRIPFDSRPQLARTNREN